MPDVLIALGFALWPAVLILATLAVVALLERDEFVPLRRPPQEHAGTRVFPARVSPPFAGEDAVTGAGAASSPVYDWSKEAA